MFLVKLCGGFHHHLHDLIASSVTPNRRNPLALKTENLSGLGSLRNAEFLFSVQGRNSDLAAQGRLDKGDRNLADHVMIVALKKLMGLHVNEDVEIPWRPTSRAAFAFVCEPQP